MKEKRLFISVIVAIMFFACKSESKKQLHSDTSSEPELVKINPLDEFKQVDSLLFEIAEKPELFSTTSSKKTTITGSKGTIVHVVPNQLETLDGSSLGDKIDIELLEMIDKSSLLLNNAQTISNGQIFITGGAYYLNMTSNGKQLRIKKGQGLQVEFPKLTDKEMGLFLGERDSVGQMNWVKTNERFTSKKIPEIKKPEQPLPQETITVLEYDPEIDSLIPPKKIERNQVSSKEYEEYLEELKKYEERKKRIEFQRRTYQAVRLLNFGWINCDRFYNDPNPKTDIEFVVDMDSLSGARIFALFKEIESMMTVHYSKSRKRAVFLRNVPIGKELKIIALSANDNTSFIFEKNINSKTDKQVQIQFVPTTQIEIEKKIKKIK